MTRVFPITVTTLTILNRMTRANSGSEGPEVDDAFWIVVVDDRFVSNDIPVHFCGQKEKLIIKFRHRKYVGKKGGITKTCQIRVD